MNEKNFSGRVKVHNWNDKGKKGSVEEDGHRGIVNI